MQKILWALSEELLPTKRVGDFNQALMELGALVCKPTNPRCSSCPLRSKCNAFAQDAVDEIPRSGKREKTVLVNEVALVVLRDDKVLLTQRPDKGRWANLWEFPHLELEPMETPHAAAERLLAALNLQGDLAGELTTLKHSVTRYRVTLAFLKVTHRAGEFEPDFYTRGEWINIDRLTDFPVSSPQRECMRLLQAGSHREWCLGAPKQPLASPSKMGNP